MERAEAQRLRDRLAAEHPDRGTHSFILSERSGQWTVAKVAIPPGAEPGSASSPRPEPLHEHNTGRLPGGISPWTAGG